MALASNQNSHATEDFTRTKDWAWLNEQRQEWDEEVSGIVEATRTHLEYKLFYFITWELEDAHIPVRRIQPSIYYGCLRLPGPANSFPIWAQCVQYEGNMYPHHLISPPA